MTLKVHRVFRGRSDLLYNPKCHGDHFCQFDKVHNPKRSRVLRRRRALFYNNEGHSDILGPFDLDFLPQKVTRTSEIAVTDFMSMTFKCPLDLLHDPKCLYGWLTLFKTKRVSESFEVALTYFMTQNVTMTYFFGLI